MSDSAQNHRDLLRDALMEIQRLRAKADQAANAAAAAPIAIVGMACRYPGGVRDAESFWKFLERGGDAVETIPASRWAQEAFYDPRRDQPGRMYTNQGSFIEAPDAFDPLFFGLSPREAGAMDPQQRLLLEVAWEALEDAACATETLKDSATGVFVGLFMDDYVHVVQDLGLEGLDAHNSVGVLRCMAAGRLAFHLGLRGPALQVDTACSSSLVAIHLACQSLRARECQVALAGGVNLMLRPEPTIGLCRLNALSTDGRCRGFDAAAQGYGRGEGCGVIVLKRLADARTAGDRILAVIRGSAVGHDGRSNGLTAPNGPAQEAVIRQAIAQAGVDPRDLQYVEAHGTGTSLGDPIEARALCRALGGAPHRGAGPEGRLSIGSVKSNFGHLEAAAGVAAVMKTVLALRHAEIPAHLHFQQPNPLIPWGELPLSVPTAATPWPENRAGSRRLAGISSFGMSGTNVHVILEEPPGATTLAASRSERPGHVLCLSAKNSAALTELVARYAAHVRTSSESALADLCFSANTGRTHFDYRAAFVVRSRETLSEELEAYARETVATAARGLIPPAPRGVALVFGADGSGFDAGARELYRTHAPFRQSLDRCAEILAAAGEPRLQRALTAATADSAPGALDDPTMVFAVQYGWANLWLEWGVAPTVVGGQGIGEYVAACVTGALELADALHLVRARGAHSANGSRQIVVRPAQVAVIAAATGTTWTLPTAGRSDSVGPVDAPWSDAATTALLAHQPRFVLEIGRLPSHARAKLTEGGISLVADAGPAGANWEALLSGLRELERRGVTLDWAAFDRPYSRRRVPLPSYPFQRMTFPLPRLQPKPPSVAIPAAPASRLASLEKWAAEDADLLERCLANVERLTEAEVAQQLAAIEGRT